MNYILAQGQKIEDVLSAFTNRKIKVSIVASEAAKHASRSTVSLDVVEGNELVKAARNLFDGTVVQVTDINKEKS
jgi:hypothetical protein